MIATRDIYGDILVELGKMSSKIVVLDADLSCSTRTQKFAQAFPKRFFNMGIAEQDMIGTASGLATSGKLPFVSTFAVFATGRCWDQIRQSVCYSNQNVKIVATHAGVTVGEDSATHQANEDIALMRVLPNMQVIVPADAIETKKVIENMYINKGPAYIRLSRCKVPTVLDSNYRFTIGKAVTLREGKDATIIACGLMVSKSLEARKMLLKKGIQVRIINMSTIKPLDKQIVIDAAKETGLIVTVEEHSIIGGLGSAVAEVLIENYPVKMKRIGVNDCFGVSGKPEELLAYHRLDTQAIVHEIELLL